MAEKQDKIKVAFLCIGNSCRSQMAEGFLRHLAGERFTPYSAGTNPASWGVTPEAIVVMDEVGVDISSRSSKGLTDIPLADMDYIITMGCGVECPYYPAVELIKWDIPDPYGEDIERFRAVREIIQEETQVLIERLG